MRWIIDYYIPHPKETFHIGRSSISKFTLYRRRCGGGVMEEYEFIEIYHFTFW